jgi:hypothetical protein
VELGREGSETFSMGSPVSVYRRDRTPGCSANLVVVLGGSTEEWCLEEEEEEEAAAELLRFVIAIKLARSE